MLIVTGGSELLLVLLELIEILLSVGIDLVIVLALLHNLKPGRIHLLIILTYFAIMRTQATGVYSQFIILLSGAKLLQSSQVHGLSLL